MRRSQIERYAFTIFLCVGALLISWAVSWLSEAGGKVASVGDASNATAGTLSVTINATDEQQVSDTDSQEGPDTTTLGETHNQAEAADVADLAAALSRLHWQTETKPATAKSRAAAAPAGTDGTARDSAADDLASQFTQVVFRHLKRFRHYPRLASRDQIRGTVWIEFAMNRDGSIARVAVLQSSGHAILDTAAIDTFRRAQPLPRIPSGIGERLTFQIGLEFDPRLG